jgi:SAGA-associated factor 29
MSSSELDCWKHTTESLSKLAAVYSDADTAGRVNRFYSSWPTDETIPAQGLDHLKQMHSRLSSGLDTIIKTSEKEVKLVNF